MIRLLSLLAAAAFAGVRVVPEASRVVGLGGSPAVLVAPAGVPAALGGDGALPSAQILPQGFDALAPIGAVAAVSDPGPSLLEVAAPPTPLAAAPLSAQQAPPQSVFTFTLPGQAAGPVADAPPALSAPASPDAASHARREVLSRELPKRLADPFGSARTGDEILFAAETNPSPENPVLAPASDAGSNPRPEVEPPPQPSPADSFLQSMAHLIGVVEERFHGLPDWEKVYDGAAAGFVRALGDRHTEYLTPAEHAAWIAEQNGEQANVGLVLRARRNGPMEILAVLPGTPAAEAGLQRGDRIVAVDGRSVTDDWFDGKPFLSGELGSKLSLKVVRASEPERDVELTRRNVHRPVGFAKRLRGGIGYLHLREFRGIGEEEFELLNTLLEGKPLKGLVLDLRFNPGGTMRSAANLAALFLEPRTRILGLHYRHKPDESVSVDHGGELRELPLVILLNGHSASASEVLAGALQDHGRARVIGTRSRGKGSSQSVYPLTRGAVKLTVALWSTPNGRRIQRQESGEGGILPDVVVNADDNEGLPLANRLLLGSAGLPDKDRRPDPALRAALAALKP